MNWIMLSFLDHYNFIFIDSPTNLKIDSFIVF